MLDSARQKLGNYRFIKLLGEGGFAKVYLGEHVFLKTKAAIKVLHTQEAEDALDNFLREAQTIANLEHPNIVHVLEFGIEHGCPFLVMNYAPNGTLRQRHKKGSQLPLPTIVSYIRQVAAALQYAHARKVIHRDIKPENMLIGLKDEIILSDFGIAIISDSTFSQITQNQAGTPIYMAPEQIEGKPRPASDQYALAVVVYEWLCGEPPFWGTSHELAMQHIVGAPSSLQQKDLSISPAVDHVVLKALEKDTHKRFANVQEFVIAFEQAIQMPKPTRASLLLIETPSHPKTLPSRKEMSADAYYDQGVDYHDRKDYQNAIQAYTRALELDSTMIDAYYNRGVAYHDRKDYQNAIHDYSRILALAPTKTKAYQFRGEVYLALKVYQKAIVDFDQALRLDPTSVDTYVNRGNAYTNLDEYWRAIADFDQALRIDPTYADAYLFRALAFCLLEEHQRAIADFDQALRIDPAWSNAYRARGVAYFDLKEYRRAITDFDQALRMDPTYADAYFYRGRVYLILKEHQRAIEDFDRALRVDPAMAAAYYYRGLAYHVLKVQWRAIQDYSWALRLAPTMTNAYYFRGKAYIAVNQYQYAVLDFRQVLKLKSTFKVYFMYVITSFLSKFE